MKRKGNDSAMSGKVLVGMVLATSLCSVGQAFGKDFTILVDPQTDSPAGTPVTFGMAFAKGDLPFSDGLTATVKTAKGEKSVPVQIDKKASHCDATVMEFEPKDSCGASERSVRHAVISTLLPDAITSGDRAEIILTPSSSATGDAGSNISFPSELSVKTVINQGTKSYVADLASVSMAELQANSLPMAGSSDAQVSEWLSGEIAREWVVRVPFSSEQASGQEHSHLVARYNIRYYRDADITRVDVVVENNWAFQPDVSSYNYAVKVFVDDELRYDESELIHFVHSRWKVTVWDGSYPELHIRHDPYQLIDAKVAPNYDPGLVFNLDSSLEKKYASYWSDHAPQTKNGVIRHENKVQICLKNAQTIHSAKCDASGAFRVLTNGIGPMGVGVVPKRYMPTTGGRDEIAPLPEWTASWVLQQSYPLYRMMLAIADGSGSWPIHFRDKNTDLPISIQDWPQTRIAKGNPTAADISTCSTGPDCLNPFVADNAHQPSFAFMPYVVTGDFYYLEEVQYWATYNSVWMAPEYRGGARGTFERSTQLRGAAWGMRNLAHASWITPDENALKPHFLYMLRSNLEEYNALYIDNPSRRVEYGAAVEYSKNISAPWMDDYFTWSIGHAVELGYSSFSALARWKGRFPVGRMGFSPRPEDEYCWIFAANYRLRVSPFDEKDPVPVVVVPSGQGTVLRERVMFKNLSDVFNYSNKAFMDSDVVGGGSLETREACATQAQADEQGFKLNEMDGYPGSTRGYVSQLQPALATAVDMGTENASAAWERFTSRATRPNFSSSPPWAIVPRGVSGGSASVAAPPKPDGSITVGGECVIHPNP